MGNYVYYFELLGTIAFAISGAMEGIKAKFDFLGVIVAGILTATGGGVIRDLLIGNIPPTSFATGTNMYIALITSIIVFVISYKSENVNRRTVHRVFEDLLIITDAVGLAAFTITGMQIAYRFGPQYSTILYVFVGMSSGVGGGILRDIILGNVSHVFTRNIYASASIVGAVLYNILYTTKILNGGLSMIICIVLIFCIRIIAFVRNWQLPIATK